MKRGFAFVFVVLLTAAFVSCANKKENLDEGYNPSLNFSGNQNEYPSEVSADSKNGKIDYDWSKMNYNMLSSVIFDLQVDPEKYAGKRIKATGNFETSIYEGRRYFSVITWDPTGCCPAGFDFIPPAGMEYPDDFPADDKKITVTCVFNYNLVDGHDVLLFEAEEIVVEDI